MLAPPAPFLSKEKSKRKKRKPDLLKRPGFFVACL